MTPLHPVARLLSSSSAPSASAQPTTTPLPTSFDQWVNDTFEYGLVGSLYYIIFSVAVTLAVLLVLKHAARKKLTGNLRFFYRLLYVIVIILGACAVLGAIKPLKNLGTAVAASSGIAGIVIGLAAQETLANLFAGISIAAAKPFVVGQYIEIINSSPPILGTVEAIKLRHTLIRDANNKQIVIPNSVLDQDVLMTTPMHETSKPTAVNNNLDVGISYNSDIKKAMSIISDLVLKQPEFVDTRTDEDKKAGKPPVTVRVTDLAASSVNLRAFVWTHTISEGYQALSNLRYLVKTAFDEEGIEIPYPYQNVILQKKQEDDTPQPRA